jgi:hypothetical protein
MKDNKALRLVSDETPAPKQRKKRATHIVPPDPPGPPSLSQADFLRWEVSTNDTLDLKKIYIDIAEGDLVAGVILSRIVYWELPDKNGNPKQRVQHDGKLWIAKRRDDWWEECRVTSRRLDRALAILCKTVCEKNTYKFDGEPTVHVRIVWDNFLYQLQSHLQKIAIDESTLIIDQGGKTKLAKREKRNSQKEKNEIPGSGIPTNTDHNKDYNKDNISQGDSDDAEFQNLINDLIAAGVTPSRAKKLAPAHAAELRRRLDFLPHLTNVQKPGALICSHVEEPWDEPPALTKARQAEAEELRAAAEARAQAMRRAEDEKRARALRELDEKLDALYKDLDAADRAEIDKAAHDHLQRVMGEERTTPSALAIARRRVLKKEQGLPTEDSTE